MSPIGKVIRKLPRVFWVSNMMELFERWAWYGFYNAFALYLTLSKDTGALGFTQGEKGWIIGTGTMLLYLLPLITGAIADRIGYKKVLILSFSMYVVGYYMVGHFNTYGWVFFAYIFLATAGAFFKPIVSAMVAKTTDKETSSIGFGIFYMMVNIGGFIGPFIAGLVYKLNWNYVFYISMAVIALNYILVFFFFKEPARDEHENAGTLGANIRKAFLNIGIALADWKYVLFLVIMTLFWTAFNQLYYTFPVFVNDWVDLNKLSASLGLAPGKITAVGLTSLDAFFIILFQLFVSSITMKFKPLHAMMGGMLILAGGLFFMFSSQDAWIIILGILVFALGEMASSPKFTEYIGRIAPLDKKALYMGTSFLPIGAAHFLAGILSGKLYANISDKFTLLTKVVADKGLHIPALSDTFTKNEYFKMATEKMSMSSHELTHYLWSQYHPSRIWILYTGIGISAAVFLFLYDHFILKGADVSKNSIR